MSKHEKTVQLVATAIENIFFIIFGMTLAKNQGKAGVGIDRNLGSNKHRGVWGSLPESVRRWKLAVMPSCLAESVTRVTCKMSYGKRYNRHNKHYVLRKASCPSSGPVKKALQRGKLAYTGTQRGRQASIEAG